MTIHQKIEEQTSLAKAYAEDGAFRTAARILKQLAEDVTAHADYCDSLITDRMAGDTD